MTAVERIQVFKDLAARPTDWRAHVMGVLNRRILSAPMEIRRSLFGTGSIPSIWQLDNVLLLSVAKSDEHEAAIRRYKKVGTPFPHLLGPPAMMILNNKLDAVFMDVTLDVSNGNCFEINGRSSLFASKVRVKYKDSPLHSQAYIIPCLLAVSVRGIDQIEFEAADMLDSLLARVVADYRQNLYDVQ